MLQFIRHLEPIIKDICLQISTSNVNKDDKLISLLAPKARVVHLQSEAFYFGGPSFSKFYNKYGEHLNNVRWFQFRAHRHTNLLDQVDFRYLKN